MNIGQAVADLGIEPPDDGDLVIVRPNPRNGRMEHYILDTYRDHEMNGGTYYLSSGAFRSGSVSKYEGRKTENVERILWLPFDFDLADYMQSAKEWPWTLTDADLWALIEGLRVDVEEAFAAIGLPIHRLDYTGYGLAAYVYLPIHKPSAVTTLQALHKAIVGRINTVARMPLADTQVSDAGPRIMRLVPSLNTKAPDFPRQTRTIYLRREPVVTKAMLEAAAQMQPPPERMIPKGRRLADDVVTLLVDHVSAHWIEGRRHQIALGLCGMLAKAGVPEDQADAVIERLGDDPIYRAKSVKTSYDRVRSGLDVRGFFALREALPAPLLEWIDTELGKVRAAGPTLILGSRQAEPAEPVRNPLVSPPPAIAFRGWFGEYRDCMLPTTESPEQFHLGAALATVGAMIGRRVQTYSGNRLFANLFVVLVGPTGQSRKDTSMNRARDFVMQVDLNHIVVPEFNMTYDVTSSEGLVETLSAATNTMLYMTEMSILLRRAKRQSTSTLLTMLTKLWDAPDRVDLPSRGNPVTADKPYLSVLTATTPDTLATDMTPDEVSSGFANRLLFFGGEGIGPKADPPKVDIGVSSFLLKELRSALTSYIPGTELSKSPQAKERFVHWYEAYYRWSYRNDDESQMAQRLPANIHKLALIYAVTDGASAIELDHLEAAIALTEWSWAFVRSELDRWGQMEEAKIANRVRDVLSRRGAIHKRQLQQAMGRKLGPGTFVRVLEAMGKSGEIEQDISGNVALYRGQDV